MKAVIIDDEPAVRNTIAALLKRSFDDICVSAMAGSVSDGYSAVMEHRPDILFLDIELPDGLGFEIIRRVSPVTFRTIFITGHQEYALDAIKVSALDYILKPVDEDELKSAIMKAREIINHEEEQLKLAALRDNLHEKKCSKGSYCAPLMPFSWFQSVTLSGQRPTATIHTSISREENISWCHEPLRNLRPCWAEQVLSGFTSRTS